MELIINTRMESFRGRSTRHAHVAERAEEVRKLAELVEDDFPAESLLDIVGVYVELAEHAERRLRER